MCHYAWGYTESIANVRFEGEFVGTVWNRMNFRYISKIKSVQYVSQRGYMGVVFKKYSEFPWRILNMCKTNIYLPIYRSLEMITLIMALLWVLFSINIQMLKLQSGIGLKFMLIKESKLNSIKHFCATFWYYCITLNFNVTKEYLKKISIKHLF